MVRPPERDYAYLRQKTKRNDMLLKVLSTIVAVRVTLDSLNVLIYGYDPSECGGLVTRAIFYFI